MANDNLSKQLSCSWGGGGPDATSEQIFQQMASQGQSFFNATGDSDAFTGPISFPSDSTNITQVGGTTLTTGTGATYTSETVWNWGRQGGSYVGSSGGVSTYYAIPFYQLGLDMSANLGSTTMRNVPDVALTGDNVYVVYNNGSTGIFGGTSCAAPLWAGFTALVNQQAAAAGRAAVGFLNPALYTIGKSASYTSCFHDTTTGNNFWRKSPSKFPAVTGYDLCTGWGTPNGTNLINALAGPPAPVNTPPVGGTHYLGAIVNTPLSTSASALAALDYDADGNTLTITAVSSASTNGPPGNVTLSSGTITYTPATGYVGADQFTYTIDDGFGGTATSTAKVTVRLGKATSVFNYVSGTSGTVNLRGYGIPGSSYDVQRSPHPDFSSQVTVLATVTAAPNGIVLYTDTSAPSPSFYRFVVH
jgi:hypothetical protein